MKMGIPYFLQRLINKYFPDKRVYAAKDEEWCYQDNWDEECSHIDLENKIKGHPRCYKKRDLGRFAECPGMILAKDIFRTSPSEGE